MFNKNKKNAVLLIRPFYASSNTHVPQMEWCGVLLVWEQS